MGRSKELAERMAEILTGEEIEDATVALAILTSGVVHYYAGTIEEARKVVEAMRRLEDRLIESSFGENLPS